jgi:hypothetical protein
MGAASAVAKKKSNSGPKPPRKVLVAFKCSEEFKDWLIRYAEFKRTTPSGVLDLSVSENAKRDGFEPAPKR